MRAAFQRRPTILNALSSARLRRNISRGTGNDRAGMEDLADGFTHAK